MTRNVSPNDIARTWALIRNLNDLAGKQPPTLIARRANDWTNNGITAAGDTGPGGVGSAALAPDTVDYQAAILLPIPMLEQLERAFIELTRPTRAELEERESTHTQDRLTKPAGSGTCPACDRFMPGGDDRTNRIIPQTGLCRSHHEGFNRRRNQEPWLTIDEYITSIRAFRGLDLEVPS